MHYPGYYAYFLLLCRTGMRQREALGLQWSDIQFGTRDDDPYRVIHVQRTYDPVHKIMNTPKNGKTRKVDMSRELRRSFSTYTTRAWTTPSCTVKPAFPRLSFPAATISP